jgi:hypothetical protein
VAAIKILSTEQQTKISAKTATFNEKMANLYKTPVFHQLFYKTLVFQKL